MFEPPEFAARKTTLTVEQGYLLGEFFAMGCPCQLLMETKDADLARQLLSKVRDETWRVEAQWSRYLETSLVQKINREPEVAHTLDDETAALLNYCDQLWQLSEGAFDITSGGLRQVWTFDGGQHVPTRSEVAEVMSAIGWQRVSWQPPVLQMLPGMQIDLGGVGKEYAVDLCVSRLQKFTEISCLVNFGGDCAVSTSPQQRDAWVVGIESAAVPGATEVSVELRSGGLATSGNAHRFVMHEGRRLSHILDARTGWPVEDAPKSITVQADSCVEAGMYATLASLSGADAANFLGDANQTFWLQS